jgi:hypothetical protein
MARLLAAVVGLVAALFCLLGHCQAQQRPDYRAALTKSLLYFEGSAPAGRRTSASIGVATPRSPTAATTG